jgi:hypothetical protein
MGRPRWCGAYGGPHQIDRCALCAQCKAALSPYTIEGPRDDGRGELPGNWIEMIHHASTASTCEGQLWGRKSHSQREA